MAIDKLKDRVLELIHSTRGDSFVDIIAELGDTLPGWKTYFRIAEVLNPLRDVDKWLRRKLRCYMWKRWAEAGSRGALCKTSAQSLAVPASAFSSMGLPSLAG